VTYGNNRYVAVGAGGVIVISYDGVTWTPVTSGVTTGTLLSVAYGNGMFIAVGPGEVPIIASSDGITWNTVNPGGDPTSMYTIVFVNNEFVAGGSNGSIVTSQDGITWSPKLENMSMNSVRGIVYGNNSLVAVGEGHMILQSGSLAVPTYVITASAVPGGSISPSSSVSIPSGGSQTFTITPNGGYHIADVLVDGLSFGAITNYTFSNVTANHTIFASFAQDPTQPLIVQISGNGSGFVDYSTGNVCQSASCTQAFAEGSSIILTAVATSGSTFAGWSGSCTGTEPCTVLMDAARTVTATFNTVPSSPDVITTVAGGWVGDGGPATMAGLASPWSVTKDASGNVYIADMRHHRIRKVDISGVITTVAGNGESGYSGDGGPALLANLNGPSGLTVDAAGNIYISDTSNHRIRKVDASGMITTVAGNGTLGYSGDGGPAVVASLNSPRGLSVDPSGNIYIADANNRRVRKVDASGTITTVAGSGAYGYSGDGGPATAASFNSTWDVAVDPAGNMYIADMGNHRVRKVDTSGIITTVAGNGIAGYSGDGGPATLASLSSPRSIAIALGGSLYIADSGNQVIRKMDPAGMIMTVAGNGTSGYSGDGGPALAASLGSAFDVAVDNAANIYIADAMNQRIRKVDASGIIDTFAGGWLGDGGPAIAATVNRPQGVALDRFGNLLIADPGHDRVRKVGASGIITTLAGDGIAGYSGDNGPANQANLNSPTSVTADAAGNVFIADTANHRVRKVDPSGVITTVAGDGTPGYYGDNGPAVSASLNSPYGVSVDSGGNVYIADMNNHRIRKIDASGVISTVAGNGLPGYSGDNGAAVSASLNAPRGVAADASGNLYIADSNNQRVRKVDPSGVITTVAGSGFRGYYGDGGPALSALLSNPASVAIDPSGAIFIADVGNQRIRKVDTSGVITTIAGNGIAGYSGDGGPATFASLSMNRAMDTGGIAVDAIGNLYIADTSNSRIRLVGSEVPTVTLTETVFNSSGIPIEGALAQVAGGSSFSALSDIYGRFVLPVPQGVTFSHIISKTGYRTWYSTSRILTVSSNGPSRTLYTDEEVAAWGVQPGYSAIRGRARDYTTGLFLNNPAASAVSTLNPAVSYPVIYDAACGTGTGTCYYTVINVAPYDPVVLTVSAPGYTTVQTTLNPLPPDAIGSAMIMLNKVPKYRVTTNSPAIAAGNEHTVALKSDGTVVAWGENDSGACTVPADLSNVTAISSGAWHTVALKSDGTVVGWGQNNSGECSPPAGLSNVIAIAAGDLFTLAAKSDGTVVSWGAGDNTVPAGLTGVTAVAAGVMHKVALKSDGTVAAWGFCNPDYGQCAAPAGLTGVTAIAAGPWHSVALKSDGTVVAWGSNLYGESSVPSDLSGVVSIAAGAMHTAALKSDGTVVTWGSYYSGTGTAPAGVSDVVAIAAGYGHTVALKSDGTLVAWGYNGYGESTVPEGLNLGAGRISCDPTTVDYNSGSVCIITPGTGHHVADVKVGSTGTPLSSVGPVTSYTIGNITADMSIAASFEMNTYTITAGAGSNGSIVPSGTLTVSHGGNGAFTITPEAGYHVADVLVDGASIGAVESYTFANVTADHTISAAFAINTYTITAAAGAGGSVVCTPATVDYGLNSMCTITANTGFHITDVLVDGVSAGAIASHPFVNVTADHTISANFAINTYTITATAGTGGAVVCTPSTVDYGLNSTCTITANTGFHITDVLVDGEPAGAITSRTFTNVTADHTISASFAINTYTITATAGPGGAIACTPSIVNYGASSACTITPDTGYHIFEVLVDGVPAGAVGTHSFTDVTADHTISVSFMINRYTIGVSKSGTGTGTITSAPAGISCGADCSEVYDFGTSVSLTATPSADSVFTGWSGACSGTGSCTLMAGSDQTVSSTFSRAITLTSPNGGDNWSRGVTYAISWTYAGDPGASVRIELLKGGVLQLAITSSTPIGSNGTGSYSWSIPKNEWGGADYTIRITSTANSSFTDVSDGPFSISK
jgi:alpha-tubulin suppressor-like RCC1 family protein/sugar lactone lactonase YvrE